MSGLSTHEKNALRYYIGDVSGSDPFLSDPKAYIVINSLFFTGIGSETARAAEGKYLNPEIISDTDRLTELLLALFSAFCSSAAETERHTFRVERYSDYALCRRTGSTVSFTSTSASGFLREYRDRLGIALMRFTLPRGTVCIDVAKALDYYAKPDEAEILLPPFARLRISELPITDDERSILDSASAPPVCSCEATVDGIMPCHHPGSELPQGGELAGQRVFAALNAGKIPDAEDSALYSSWKREYAVRLHRQFTQMLQKRI